MTIPCIANSVVVNALAFLTSIAAVGLLVQMMVVAEYVSYRYQRLIPQMLDTEDIVVYQKCYTGTAFNADDDTNYNLVR